MLRSFVIGKVEKAFIELFYAKHRYFLFNHHRQGRTLRIIQLIYLWSIILIIRWLISLLMICPHQRWIDKHLLLKVVIQVSHRVLSLAFLLYLRLWLAASPYQLSFLQIIHYDLRLILLVSKVFINLSYFEVHHKILWMQNELLVQLHLFIVYLTIFHWWVNRCIAS